MWLQFVSYTCYTGIFLQTQHNRLLSFISAFISIAFIIFGEQAEFIVNSAIVSLLARALR